MEMVFGCGIDIEELSRFDRHIENNDDSFMKDICSKRELHNLRCDARMRLALSFSCKEAFFKALGVSWTNSNISWKDIELLFHGTGLENYTVRVNNYAHELLVKHKIRVEEALFDYNDEFVMFQVILLTNSDIKRENNYN